MSNKKNKKFVKSKDPQYLLAMSSAPSLNEGFHWFQFIPIIFFTSVIMIFVKMMSYTQPMAQFYWYVGDDSRADFFSLFKSYMIIIAAVLAVILILYRVFTQSLAIKKSILYIPMGIYSLFVLLSYLSSDYKDFALWGWGDRFEGTLVLLSYMVMVFYIINTVSTEKHVRWIVYATGAVTSIMGLLGLSQYFGHDFFRTTFGKRLITPSTFWDQTDSLNFTFNAGQIYQTVYNINYVSFYLTLLVPLFGMLFIREKELKKKILFGAVFALLLFNLIGSASSSGILGIGVAFILAVIILNKRLLKWWKSVLILLAIVLAIGGFTAQRFMPELIGAIKGALNSPIQTESTQLAEAPKDTLVPTKIDYIDTQDSAIVMGLNGETLIFGINDINDPVNSGMSLFDGDKKQIAFAPLETGGFEAADSRFANIKFQPALDEANNAYTILTINDKEWPFLISSGGITYVNELGKTVDLDIIPHYGFDNNMNFGSGRGFIWSRTFPMLKDRIIIGSGADTFCIYFPHNDYVGKINTEGYSSKINIVVDKPHNMYLGMFVGTGGISVLAFLAIFIIYFIQSVMALRKNTYEDFLSVVGAGIFFGVCGFMVSAIVNDSSVSVMPLFYGLLATGIAINIKMLRERR